MANKHPKRPVALKTFLEETSLSRTLINRKIRDGVITKFNFLGSDRVFLDRDELESAFSPTASNVAK
jgi:hypothetical protein